MLCVYGSYTQEEEVVSCYVDGEPGIFTVEDNAISVSGDIEKDGEYYFTYKYVFELCTQELNVMTPTEWDEYWEETAQATSYTITDISDDEYTFFAQIDLINNTISIQYNDIYYIYFYYDAANGALINYGLGEDGCWYKQAESMDSSKFNNFVSSANLFFTGLPFLCSPLVGNYEKFMFDVNTNSYTTFKYTYIYYPNSGNILIPRYSDVTITFEESGLKFYLTGDTDFTAVVSDINNTTVTIPQEIIDSAKEMED